VSTALLEPPTLEKENQKTHQKVPRRHRRLELRNWRALLARESPEPIYDPTAKPQKPPNCLARKPKQSRPRKATKSRSPGDQEPQDDAVPNAPSMIREWLDAGPTKPCSPGRELIRRLRGKTAKIGQLLSFAQQKLQEPIRRLVTDHGPVDPIHSLRPQYGRRPVDWRWQLGLRVLASGNWRLVKGCVPEIEDVLRIQILICCEARDEKLLKACGVPQEAADAVALILRDRQFEGRRLQLHARILARTAEEQIAKSLSLMVETIQFYGRWFFDVADRLDAPDFVILGVIENEPGPYEQELLRLAYAGGPAVAEHLLLGFDPGAQRPKTAGEVEGFLRNQIRRTVARKAALAMGMLDVSCPKEALQIMRLFLWQVAQEQRSNQRQSSNSSLQAGIDAFRTRFSELLDGKTPLQVMADSLAAKEIKLPKGSPMSPELSQSA
jgi:hypothetical protein